ncbi:cytochrome P450 [Catellatospora chokoriensis]|uniref:Cytochrome P450 n=1 Tax=Catellatospora chokoriensis TaxID=310353 RepID=A0A8J3JYV5_9ACTN|nr:cytochrome P450 [Catellatospora chokoriensis]GIF93621.1 cytochrome P450 [Catellatospora chokoriensis]
MTSAEVYEESAGTAPPGVAQVSLRRTLVPLARDPLGGFERIGRAADGRLARLNLGLTRPYLVTHPDHVQHVLRRPDLYRREGMMWKPLQRLEGDGIAGEGPSWQVSRHILQPMFTARNLGGLFGTMADAVTESLSVLQERAARGREVDLVDEMTAIAHRVLIRVLFSDRITFAEAERLGQAITAAFTSLGSRMLMPFVPDAVPMPGDRPFARAVRTVDELIYPRIRACRAEGSRGDDLVAVLARTVGEDGQLLDDKRVRDDVVSMFVAGTETTGLALTWLWLLLQEHPEVREQVVAEVADVVGDGPAAPQHLPGLVFTRMVLQEALRLYPVGWVVPRTLAQPDELAGTRLSAGTTVLLSPYLTHRVPQFWDEPEAFRPQRFSPDREQRRHRFAYFPFGAGVHQCLGSHFFTVEAQLIVAGMLSRFRPRVAGEVSLRPRATASLRPRQRARMVLDPAA